MANKFVWLSIAFFCSIFKLFPADVGNQGLPEGSLPEVKAQMIIPGRVAQLQKVARGLQDTIALLERKVQGSRGLESFLRAWQNTLDMLKSSAVSLSDVRYAHVASRKEFDASYALFISIGDNLKKLVDDLVVEEFSLEGDDFKSESRGVMTRAVHAIASYFRHIRQGSFFESVEKFQELYDKEAKELRESELGKEELARQQQREGELNLPQNFDYGDNFYKGDYFFY